MLPAAEPNTSRAAQISSWPGTLAWRFARRFGSAAASTPLLDASRALVTLANSLDAISITPEKFLNRQDSACIVQWRSSASVSRAHRYTVLAEALTRQVGNMRALDSSAFVQGTNLRLPFVSMFQRFLMSIGLALPTRTAFQDFSAPDCAGPLQTGRNSVHCLRIAGQASNPIVHRSANSPPAEIFPWLKFF